ncbi:uncharacterized protein N7500_003295 [Penicillium coprophilum]|uniref:uncharacterized protein n=1 Tax=Penicillium coprophilum TaxID=36646 RepID=UPI00239EF3C4|nr:uncharacterized protein N7500_003295 [Penicillium coprophilum]KAJ5170512.1 hypothetical protein N7500_003295 [Penicillium coprophilum]
MSVNRPGIHQQANVYQGVCPQGPVALQQFIKHQGNFNQKTTIHQGYCFPEPLAVEQLNTHQNNFDQQGGWYQRDIIRDSQHEIYHDQQKLANQASGASVCGPAFSKAQAIDGDKSTQEASQKPLDHGLDIDTILSSNNKLLRAAADFQEAGLLSSFMKHPVGRLTDDSRNLEHDWIMRALKIKLIYLEACRRRAEANK